MASNLNSEDLIEQVRQHSIIWDVKNQKHKNRQIVANAWIAISKALNATESDCKNRWRCLRDNYQRTFNCQRVKKTGSAATPSGRTFFMMEQMSFLNDSALASKTESNIQDEDADGNTDLQATGIDLDLQETIGCTSNEALLFADLDKPVPSPTTSFSSVSSCAKNTSESIPIAGGASHLKTKKRTRNEASQSTFEHQFLSKLNELGEDDEYSSYGNYIAHELKSFSRKNQCILKHKIEQLIFDMRMNEFGETSTVEGVWLLFNFCIIILIIDKIFKIFLKFISSL